MKRLLLIAVLLMGVSMYAQDSFKRWSLGVEYGNHYLNDRSAQNRQVLGKAFTHLAVNTRYNFSRTFGLGARLSYGYLKMVSHDNVRVNEGFPRFNIEAVVDVFDVVGLDRVTDQWNMLTYFGPGVGWFQGETVANLYGGVSVMKKLCNVASLKLSYGLTGNINQRRTFDGRYKATAEGITSQLHTVALGVDFHLKGRKKIPADYYVPECCASGDTIINNNITKKFITEKTEIIKEEYNPVIREFVFFDHDKSKVRKSELNAIYQIYNALLDDDKANVSILGWASDTKSSAAYNLALSKRRCLAIKKKLEDMGIGSSRIVIDPSGKDYDFNVENVHDVARRVEMLITE